MPNFDDIKTLIEKCKTPYLRISDMHNNKIICIECTTVSACINELDEFETMLKTYGKVEVCGATADMFKSNWRGAYKWILIFDKVSSAVNQMNGMSGMNWGQAPAGYVHQDVMAAQIASIKQEMDFNKKFAELEAKLLKKDEYPEERYMGYAPMIMSALGHDDAKIEKMIKWFALSKGAKGIAFAPTNTLTFKDVEQMTPEQKNDKIQTLLDSLSGKVSAEHMILLLEALDKNPALAEKAINILATL